MAFNKEKEASRVYKLVQEVCDGYKLRYAKDDQYKRVEFDIQGDHELVKHVVTVNEKINVVFVLSDLPVQVDEKYSQEVAQAVNVVNCRLAYGSFDYNYRKGQITFRLPTNYTDMSMEKETINSLIMLTYACVNKYNGLLIKVAKGIMLLDQFVKIVQGA